MYGTVLFKMVLLILGVLIQVTLIGGELQGKLDYPNPQLDPASCGRGIKSSWICDPSGILDTKQADYIDDQIKQLVTPCLCHHEPSKCATSLPVAIAIIPEPFALFSVGEQEKNKKRATLEIFGDYLRDISWKFGSCSDDLIILVSADRPEVYTALGNATRHAMGELCADNIPAFSSEYFINRDYGGGLLLMLSLYEKALNGSTAVCSERPSMPYMGPPPVAMAKKSKSSSDDDSDSRRNPSEKGEDDKFDETGVKDGQLYTGIVLGSVFAGVIILLGCIGIYMCLKAEK